MCSPSSQAQAQLDVFMTNYSMKKTASCENKIMAAQTQQAKKTIIDQMIAEKKMFIQYSDGVYILLKKKTTGAPSLKGGFMVTGYHAFQRKKGKNVPADEGSEFLHYLMEHQKKAATTTYDLEVSKSKPLASLFQS
jgi:hypothetical protein